MKALWLWLDWRLRCLARPYFRCEDCVGVGPHYACYCAFHDCVAPCQPPGFWRRGLRKSLKFLGMDSL